MSDGESLDINEAASGGAASADSYRVLARKYRPSIFAELIGQEAMVRTLTNAFASGRIAQAYMLTGVRGVGKTTTARILARALNYETDAIDRPTIDFPQGEGEHCRAIMEGRHPDVIEMDAASHTGVDNMRDILASLQYAPIAARYKVYIIDEVHMLSSGAFNAMLKTLEEPPAHVKFVFATTEIRKVPITVLSRCQRFDLRRVDAETMISHLAGVAKAEGVEVERAALAAIARASEGSVRDALSLLDQAIALSLTPESAGEVSAETVRGMLGLADRTRVIDLFDALMKGDMPGALNEFAAQYDAGAQPLAALTDLASHVHLVSRLKFVPDGAGDASLSEEERTRGLAAAEALSTGILSRAWQMLLRGLDEVERAPDPRLAADMVLIRLAHAASLPGPEEALRMLEAGGSPSEGDGTSAGTATPQADRGGGSAGASSAPVALSARATGSMPARTRGGALRAADDAALDLDVGERPTEPTRGHLSLVHDAEPTAAPMQARDAPDRAESAPTEDAPPEHAQTDAPADDPLRDPARVMAALAEISGERRDIALRTALRRQLRLVALDAADPERPVLTLTSDEPLARGLNQEIARKLKDWTGTRWSVAIDPYAEGGATLHEGERREEESRLADATADPDVAAILDAFPGARVVAVRPRGAVEEAALPEEPDAVPLDPDAETLEDE